jgi:hypothetical protein
MEEIVNTGIYKSAHPLSASDKRFFTSLFAQDKGVVKVTVSEDEVIIEYNRYLLTGQQIAELLVRNGYTIMKKRKQGFIQRQIEYLAKSNRKNFGSGKPDCC